MSLKKVFFFKVSTLSSKKSKLDKTLTPANWVPGQPVIVAVPQTYAELEERKKYIEKNNNGLSWYLSYMEPVLCQIHIQHKYITP